MNQTATKICLAMTFVLLLAAGARAQTHTTLVWSDEFDGAAGSAVDSAKWGFDVGGGGWGNKERQYYTNTSDNAALDGAGNLVITAKKSTLKKLRCWYGRCGYTSARILTKGKFSQAYGRFEARIKVPHGQGIWPAFWMLGSNIDAAGWPVCGEIDIMENIGREPAIVHGTIHGPGYNGAKGIGSPYALTSGAFSDAFHVYAVDWEPNRIRWYVDGNLYQTRTPSDLPAGTAWAFDHSFFIILNLAVGGNWPGDPDSTTTFPQRMLVDYVRVYR